MSQQCKFCKSTMISEFHDTHYPHAYEFFHICPNCFAVYEGKDEKTKTFHRIKSRWYDPIEASFFPYEEKIIRY